MKCVSSGVPGTIQRIKGAGVMDDPPTTIELSLAEAILLVGALEDALNVFDRLVRHQSLQVLDVMGPMLGLED